MASRSRSTTTDPTEPGTGAATPSGTPLRRPPPLPAVKGTIGGIESQSPRLAFSPAGSASVVSGVSGLCCLRQKKVWKGG